MGVFSCLARCSELSPSHRMERIRAKQEKYRQGRVALSHPQEPLDPDQEPGEWMEPQGPLSTGVICAAGAWPCLCHVTSHRASSPSVLCHVVTLCPSL